METTKRDRTPIYGLLFICGLIAVFGLFVFAMSISGWMLLGLVFCFGVTGALILVFQWGYTATRLKWQTEQNRHIEAVLDMGFTPDSYQPVQLQIEAPAEPEGGSLQESEIEQYKPLALQLIGVTYEKLGQQSKQLIPFNRCAVDRISPFDDVNAWTNARGWLLSHGFAWKQMKGQKCIGIYFSNGQTVGDVYRRMTS